MADEAVLIIDDDPSVRDVLIRFVQIGSYRAYGASSALQGLREFEVLRPDLIITDVFMPDMNGFELCERIRGQLRRAHHHDKWLPPRGTCRSG